MWRQCGPPTSFESSSLRLLSRCRALPPSGSGSGGAEGSLTALLLNQTVSQSIVFVRDHYTTISSPCGPAVYTHAMPACLPGVSCRRPRWPAAVARRHRGAGGRGRGLEEVGHRRAGCHHVADFVCFCKVFDLPLQGRVEAEDGCHVAAAVAVVRGRPYCHQCLILEPVLETVHDKLVSTSNELQIIDMIEF